MAREGAGRDKISAGQKPVGNIREGQRETQGNHPVLTPCPRPLLAPGPGLRGSRPAPPRRKPRSGGRSSASRPAGLPPFLRGHRARGGAGGLLGPPAWGMAPPGQGGRGRGSLRAPTQRGTGAPVGGIRRGGLVPPVSGTRGGGDVLQQPQPLPPSQGPRSSRARTAVLRARDTFH